MLWWDWSWRPKLLLLGAMLSTAALPCLLAGWLPQHPDAFLGGMAFLTIPQIVCWFLFVGLRTGRMPSRGMSERREEAPLWFWITAACYAGMLVPYLWLVAEIVADLARSSGR